MQERTVTAVVLSAAFLCTGPVFAAELTPTAALGQLPRLATPGLSCQAIAPTVELIDKQTKAMVEQAEFIAERPRDNVETPTELAAQLEDPSVTMCIADFGEYDWLMDLDFRLDSALSGLKEERGRRMDACPQQGGLPEPKCLAKLDAELAARARQAAEAYLEDAQAGLDTEATRMASCTQRRDDLAERLFAVGGHDLQALGLNVESWRLAQVATKRWKAVCSHASGVLGGGGAERAGG